MKKVSAIKTEGWARPGLSRKFHYFTGGVSLCSKWMYTGLVDEDDGKDREDDCAACKKKLRARTEMTA